MTTIIAGSPASFTLQVQVDGDAIAVTGPVSARIYSVDGRTEVMADTALADGGGWADGQVLVQLTGDTTSSFPLGRLVLVLIGPFGMKRFGLYVEALFSATRTSLFIKDIVLDELRRDRLMAAAAGVLQDVKFTDDYLWDKVRAAESEISHALRVPLVPTKFFPLPPTQAQLDALDGIAWEIEPGYDYDPSMFEVNKWGYIVTRQRPIISVDSMIFAYPAQDVSLFQIPPDWLRIDQRYGQIRIVPSSSAPLFAINEWAMSMISNGTNVPAMVQLTYTAGLIDAAGTYPELIDIIKKKAVLKIIGDAFLPQSGSISADGLSQSISADMGKYNDVIDETLNGGKGSNGGLMAKIHGIRLAVA